MAENQTAVASIFDVEPAEIEVTVTFENGDAMLFKARAVPYKRWQELGRMVPEPSPPPMGLDKNDRPIYNMNDSDYLMDRNRAQDKRTLLRLSEFLQLDWRDVADPDARATLLEERMDVGVINSLTASMFKFSLDGSGEAVASRAATFHA